MNSEEFWQVIDLAQNSVEKLTEIPDWMLCHLREQPIEYIAGYANQFFHLHRLSYDARLWGAASLMMRFCSDDKFEYFRAWLIAKGKFVFEAALENPDSLATVNVDGDFNVPILYKFGTVAEEAYRARAGEMADITDLISIPKLVLLRETDWDGDYKKLPEMFPRLHLKYGEKPV